MALDPVVNFFRSEIATLPVTAGAVTIVLASGDGAKLPNPAVDGAFNLTIYNEADQFTAPEIVRVTARSSDTLTVTRAQEGTTATTKTAGAVWTVVLTPTAKMITDIDTAKVNVADIVNNLTSTSTTAPLSANQGKVLQDGKLNLSGGTMTGDLTIPDKIIHSGDTDTAIRFPANDTVSIETGGAERLRINSAGIDVTGRMSITTTTSPTTEGQYGYNFLGGTYIWSKAGSNSDFILYRSTGNEGLVLTSAGDVGIAKTPTAGIRLDVNGAIRTSTGILFGTDTAAANTLDDYEEGTWTPTVVGSTTAGTYTLTQLTSSYTKIGRLVTLRARFDFSEATGGVGNVLIGNLPFAYRTNSNIVGNVATNSLNTVSPSSNGISIRNITGDVGTELFFALNIDNELAENIGIGAVSTSTRIIFNVTYETA